MINPSFPCMDDCPTNQGYGNFLDWDDVRLAFPRYPDDEDIEEDNGNEEPHTEQDF